MNCPHCGKEIPDNTSVCPECLRTIQSVPAPAEATAEQQPLPMKWYKFLIFFALWANAILNILGGVAQLSGGTYSAMGDVTAQDVYAYFGQGLRALDIVMGLCMIALGVFSIYVRFRLARYKKNAPKLLLILYGANLIVSLLYPLIATAITHLNLMDSSWISTLVTCAVMIFVNSIYFKKRAHLFCN